MEHLINYLLHLADNNLIIGHRNSEWCGHGPILEQDIAISNIALDHIGLARNLYQHAASLINQQNNTDTASEDALAYLRDGWDFKNALLAEQPNGDWAQTTLRQFLFSTYQYYLLEQLQNSSDAQLAAIAAKSIKEVKYHVRWSSEWVIRLGDGTEESKQRLLHATNELWMFTNELFEAAAYENALLSNHVSADLSIVKEKWVEKVSAVFAEATIPLPNTKALQTGGKTGIHSEHLGYILAEMQFLQRAYPGAEW